MKSVDEELKRKIEFEVFLIACSVDIYLASVMLIRLLISFAQCYIVSLYLYFVNYHIG